MFGGMLLRQTLKVAEDDGRSVLVGKTTDLLVECLEDGFSFVLETDSPGCRFSRMLQTGNPFFVRVSTGRLDAGPRGHATRDPMKPTSDRGLVLNGFRLADQNQKGRLKGVLRVVFVIENRPTDAENHRPMALDQNPKGGIGGATPMVLKLLKQLAITSRADRAHLEEGLQVVPSFRGRGDGHCKMPLPESQAVSRHDIRSTDNARVAIVSPS